MLHWISVFNFTRVVTLFKWQSKLCCLLENFESFQGNIAAGIYLQKVKRFGFVRLWDLGPRYTVVRIQHQEQNLIERIRKAVKNKKGSILQKLIPKKVAENEETDQQASQDERITSASDL